MNSQHVVVVGAGIVGVTCALTLQREGHRVVLVDKAEPGMGCTFGNGGAISPDFCVPLSMPGMVKRVPRWLGDPLGPLYLNWRQLPQSLPWLLRWVAAGRSSRVRAISSAMRALHAPSLDMYRGLLGAAFNDLVAVTGQMYVWRNPSASPSEELARALRESHGISVRSLTPGEIREIEPAIAPGFTRGLFFPENGHAVNPLRMVNAMVEAFRQNGGTVVNATVDDFERVDDRAMAVYGDGSPAVADLYVLAAGLDSVPLARKLGDRVPLQAERGYHVMLPQPGVRLSVKIGNRDQMFGMTPMEDGVRISGTVEITSPDTPPDMRRAEVLLRNAKQMYPGLNGTGATFWSGCRPSSPDSLPVIGRAARARNVVYAFGHGHSGMTGAPMTARLVADLAAGRPPSIDPAAYLPTRF